MLYSGFSQRTQIGICLCVAHVHCMCSYIDYASHHETISLPQLHHEMNALFATKCVWEIQLVSLRNAAHSFSLLRVCILKKVSHRGSVCVCNGYTSTWSRGFAFSSGTCRPASHVEALHKWCMMYRRNTTNKSSFLFWNVPVVTSLSACYCVPNTGLMPLQRACLGAKAVKLKIKCFIPRAFFY